MIGENHSLFGGLRGPGVMTPMNFSEVGEQKVFSVLEPGLLECDEESTCSGEESYRS